MVMPMKDPDVAALVSAKEVVVQTTSGLRVIIWVVEHDGAVYVRSYRGDAGRWYREARRDGRLSLSAGEVEVLFDVVVADDPASIEAADEGFRSKYPNEGIYLDAMLVPEVLPTTLRLEPVE